MVDTGKCTRKDALINDRVCINEPLYNIVLYDIINLEQIKNMSTAL